MPEIDKNKILEMYRYHISDSIPIDNLIKADGAFVFGRADPLVGHKVGELFKRKLINYAMISGGLGKDSYPLTEWNIPESHFQAAIIAVEYGVSPSSIYCELKAKNGGDNARNGIETILDNSLPHEKIIVVSHPTSLKRLSQTLILEAQKKGFESNFQYVATDYLFDPSRVKDQKETVGEMLRLARYPKQGFLRAQKDLPKELLLYAESIEKQLN